MHMQRKVSSKRKQKQYETGAKKRSGKTKRKKVERKTGQAVNRWHHQLARACLRSRLGTRAPSRSHEKNNCVPGDGTGESTWSRTRASATQKQPWLSSTRSQRPLISSSTERKRMKWKLMDALAPSLQRTGIWDYFSRSQEVLEILRALTVSLKIDYLGLLVSRWRDSGRGRKTRIGGRWRAQLRSAGWSYGGVSGAVLIGHYTTVGLATGHWVAQSRCCCPKIVLCETRKGAKQRSVKKKIKYNKTKGSLIWSSFTCSVVHNDLW